MTLQEKLNYFKELRAKATHGEWVVQQKSLSNFDHPYIFDRTYGAILDPMASSTKLINRPNCDFVCESANEWNNIIAALEKAVDSLEIYAMADNSFPEYGDVSRKTLSEIRKLLEVQG